MMPSLLAWIALASAGMVYWDARRRRITNPVAWAGAVFIFWIVAVPVYLWRRRGYGDSA